MTSSTIRPFSKDLIWIALIFGMFISVMLGTRPLTPPDEGRYVEIPREMVASHDFVTPRLNGVKYFEKPPLFYWAQAGAMKAFGDNEWGWRFVNAAMALMTILGTYIFGRAMFGRKSGIMASVTLGSMLLFYAMSRVITLDMTVSALITGALGCFWLAIQPLLNPQFPGEPTRNDNDQVVDLPVHWIPTCKWLFFVFMALAVLAKGLIGAVIPGTIILLWVMGTRNWRALRLPFNPLGILLFLSIAAPWHILVSLENPEFPHFYFIQEHFLRYLTPLHKRVQPPWFFVGILAIGLFPFQGFLVSSIKSMFKTKTKALDVFLAIWFAFVLVFFSISQSKLIPYILPALPPIALLLGRYLIRVYYKESPKDYIGIFTFLGFSLIISIALGCLLLGYLPQPLLDRIHDHTFGMPQELLAFLRLSLIGTSAILLGGSILTIILLKKPFKIIFTLMILTSNLAFLSLNAGFGALAPRSIKDLALELRHKAGPQDMIATYQFYPQDLPPYLKRTITIVGWKGELEFGTSIQDTNGWMMSEDAFWKNWNSTHQKIFLITGKDEAKQLLGAQNRGKKIYHVLEKRDRVLLSNQP